MTKKCCFLSIIALLFYGLILSNPLPAFSEEEYLDLSPLYYKKTDDSRQSAEVRILGPLFELKYSPEKLNYALRPVLDVEEDIDKKKINIDFFWPLGRYARDEKGVLGRFIPFYYSKYETQDDGRRIGSTLFLPFYIGGEAENGKYNLFFPFYGNLKKWLNKDELKFIGFPLYVETRKGDDRGWEILWPIFHYAKGEGHTGFKFFPFYGFDKAEGKYLKKYYLWPFYSNQKFYEGNKLAEESLIVLPFYGYEKSEEREVGVVMFPLYLYDNNKKRNYARYDIIWPVFSFTSGETRQVRQFFPLFRFDKSEDITHNFFLWPFFWFDKITTDGHEKKVKTLVPFFTDRKETWTDGKKTARKINLWPFLSYRRDKEDRTEISSLSLIPFSGEGLFIEKFEKNFSPFWTFCRYNRDKKGNSETTLFWDLYKYQKKDDWKTIKIPLLFSYESDKSGKGFSILKGLFEHKKEGVKNHWRVLYFPLK